MSGVETLPPRLDPLDDVLRRYLETGDEAAMEEIVSETRPRLVSAARRIGNPQDAEDAVQAAYLSLVRRRGTAFEAPLFAWLLTAVVRIAYRRKAILRREDAIARRLALDAATAGGAGDAFSPEDLERLRREVGRLPARYRDPVLLHHVLGLSTGETARLLDVPEATVRTRCRRARSLVRARWSPAWVAAALAVPWFVSDAWRASPSGAAVAVGGGAMKAAGVTVAVGVLAAAAGAFAGAQWLGRKEPAEADVLRARVAELSRDRAELETQLAAAEKARLAAVPTPVAPPAPEGAMSPPSSASSAPEASGTPAATSPDAALAKAGPAFLYPDREDVLKEVDWKEVGTSLHAMLPMMARFVASLREGKSVRDMPEIGSIAKHNGALIAAAMQMSGKLPGRDINGTFTHPYAQVNAIAATLLAAGMPLTPAQHAALERIGREHSEADAQKRAGYDERTQALQQILDEADGRERFYEAALGALSTEQRNLLKPEGTGDLLHGELFSSGLVWAQYARPMPFSTVEALAATIYEGVIAPFGIPESRQADAKAIVQRFASAYEGAAAAPTHAEIPLMTVAETRAAAARQLEMQTRLLDLSLDADVAKKIRDHEKVYVPQRTGTGGR